MSNKPDLAYNDANDQPKKRPNDTGDNPEDNDEENEEEIGKFEVIL